MERVWIACFDINLKSAFRNIKSAILLGPLLLALSFLSAMLHALCLPVWAQRPEKVPRLGYLSPSSPSHQKNLIEALQEGLRALGWVEGQNISIEYRWAGGKYERLPELAAELVRLRVDVIYANSGPSAVAAKRATSTVPIVFETLGDPESAGLVASLARPGGNLTGVSGLGPELSGKQIELLKEIDPQLTRVAVLANPSNKMAAASLRETEIAARLLGVKLQVLEVSEPEKLEGAFSALTRDRANALMVLADPMFGTQRKRILALVEKNRLPAIYVETGWVSAGGLMSYSPSLPEQFRKAAMYVDRILRGAKPAELPVQQPTKFEMIINLKAARQIGLTIPPNVLARADRVVK